MNITNAVLYLVTVPSMQVGKHLANALLERNAVACVNILPSVTSIYRWKGAIQEEQELLLICKSQRQHMQLISEIVRSNHPYEVPEVIQMPITDGLPTYLQWIVGETDGAENKNQNSLE